MSTTPNRADETQLRDALKTTPADWETRKQLAHLLYDQGSFADAAALIWEADEIPSIDVELAFAARVLAKAAPRKAIRLLTALLEHNRGKAVQNLGLANALLHHGMVLQAARFYGAALEADPSFANPELEHFMLWTDDEESLWGDFQNRRPQLGELPWMKRDPKEAMKLTSRISHHTTPVQLPSLKPSAGEDLNNDVYQQKAQKGAEPTPPPAVTIPLDRVDPQYRLFDEKLGAPDAAKPAQAVPVAVKPAVPPSPVPIPVKELAKPDFATSGGAIKPPAPPTRMAPPPTIPLATAAPTSRPKPPLPPLRKP